MKKTYLIIFCLIFLLIPTYIVVSFFLGDKSIPLNMRSLKEIELSAPSGRVYEFDLTLEGSDGELLREMYIQKKKAPISADELKKVSSFDVRFISGDYETECKYYISSDPSGCYILETVGVSTTYYRIPTELAKSFLESDYSEGVYSYSKPPVMLIGGKEIAVSSADWIYKTYQGAEKPTKELEMLTDIPTEIGAISPDLDCVFEVKPDELTLTLKKEDSGETVYSGDLEGVRQLSVKENYNVIITVRAKWKNSDDAYSYGETEYIAKARIHAAADFFIDSKQVTAGDFLILSAKNIIDVSKIKVTATPDLGYTPVFFNDGDYCRAYLPTDINAVTEKTAIVLHFSYDDTEKSISFILNPRENDSAVTVYNVPKEFFSENDVTDNPYTGLYSLLAPSIGSASDLSTGYFNGALFDTIHKSGNTVRAEFGEYVKYGSSSKDLYRAHDIHYVVSNGSAVGAIARGKVVYIGTTQYTGGIVVIDHGWGMLSWYWNLSRVESGLSVGSVVENGDRVGYNGGGGLSEVIGGNNCSVHIALTVFDKPVDLTKALNKTYTIVKD